MSTGYNKSGWLPSVIVPTSYLVPISRKLPSILTQNISPIRIVATDTQCTVLDIFESTKFTFVISQISIFDVEKKSIPDVRYSTVSSASEITPQRIV